MLKFLKRCFWCLPTILMWISFVPMTYVLTRGTIEEERLAFLILFGVIVVCMMCGIGQMVYQIVHITTKKSEFSASDKIVWSLLVAFFAPFMIPCYYLMHMEKDPKSFAKYSFIPYIFLPIIGVIISLVVIFTAPLQKFYWDDHNLEISLNYGWEEQLLEEDSAFDIAFSSESEGLFTGVITYDLSKFEEFTPARLFQFHINDLDSIRSGFSLAIPKKVEKKNGRKITSAGYTGDWNDKKDVLYVISMIEFDQDPSRVLIVIQSALDSENQSYQDELRKIVHSIQFNRSNKLEVF